MRVLASTLEDAYLEAVGEDPSDAERSEAGRAADEAPSRAVPTARFDARASSASRSRRACGGRVFAVVARADLVFLVLYGLGVQFAFDEVANEELIGGDLVDEQALVGSTVFGLAMFATLFLGAVLAVFLTIGVVRGDAETGLLQPLVVRPLGRGTMLVARWAGAAVARGLRARRLRGRLALTTGVRRLDARPRDPARRCRWPAAW